VYIIKTTLLAGIAVILTVLAVGFGGREGISKQPTWEDILAEAKNGGYRIITTEELAARYREAPTSLLLVDTRQEWEYRTGHIDGAISFPTEPTWWARWRKAGKLEKVLGPDRKRLIVFY